MQNLQQQKSLWNYLIACAVIACASHSCSLVVQPKQHMHQSTCMNFQKITLTYSMFNSLHSSVSRRTSYEPAHAQCRHKAVSQNTQLFKLLSLRKRHAHAVKQCHHSNKTHSPCVTESQPRTLHCWFVSCVSSRSMVPSSSETTQTKWEQRLFLRPSYINTPTLHYNIYSKLQ